MRPDRATPRVLLPIVALVFAAACAAAPAVPTTIDEPARTIYVVSHGWHAGIVLRTADVTPARWSVVGDFPDAEYLEVGWGDRHYYPAHDPSLWLAVRAALWPSDSVLHVVGFRGPVERYFPASDIVELRLSARGLEDLIAALQASHAVDTGRRPVALGPGLYGDSRFYASRERFHLFNTCNVWTARMLRTAGVSVSMSLTAGDLMAQLQQHGRVLRDQTP